MDQRAQLLASGLAQLDLSLSSNQQQQLLDYLDFMSDWNRRINLTAVVQPTEQVTRHLLDSLSVAPYLDTKPFLDVGTGAGLPGLPLAVFEPDRQAVLLDSSVKRISFIRFAASRLGLKNLTLETARVQEYQPGRLFSQIISRAFASLQQMVDNAGHLLAPDGRLLAMKGRYPEQEIASLPPGWALQESIALQVPGLDEERHLLVLTRKTA